EQDMRYMEGLASKLPFTWIMMLIGTLALTGVGIPHVAGFAGFYSKDAIVEAAYAANTAGNYAFWTLVVAAFMTSFYSWRLMFMTSQGDPPADRHVHAGAPGSPPVMLIPLGLLAIGAVFAGLLFQPYFIGGEFSSVWGASLYEAPDNEIRQLMQDLPG